ncbi:MAG: preprotein translocase subunit SecG [Dehalococcoidia bacterium]|nr:preprotein translocase subunit SecG [Dehalococcoidia bacterium]
MKAYLNIAQIVISIAVLLVILLQVRGGGLGGIFGSQEAVFRTRRGIEKTLFRFTIVMVVVLVLVSMLSVRLA